MAEVVGCRQVLDPASITQAVRHKIHAPHLIAPLGQLQRHQLIEARLAFLRSAQPDWHHGTRGIPTCDSHQESLYAKSHARVGSQTGVVDGQYQRFGIAVTGFVHWL